jgi:hypothetical protein
MADMGLPHQFVRDLVVAAGLLAALLAIAFLVGRFFRSTKIRKRIMIGALAVYLVALVSFIGFVAIILAGNIN